MALPFDQINFFAVLVGGVINMAVGFVWYGPLFGKLWLRLIGKTEEDIAGGPGLGYLWSFIAALVTALVLSLLIASMGSTTFAEGLLAGVLVAVGFVATTSLTSAIFDDKHLGVWLLFAGYQLVVLAIVGGMLAIWR